MPSTKTKVAIARAIAAVLLGIGLKPQRRIRRRGIVFDIDLREGIDLSLFLFGRFQSHIIRFVRHFVPADGVIADVGANIGSLTLPFAALLPRGHVYAIEPTGFAYTKLVRNLSENPALTERITPVQAFIADEKRGPRPMIAYSSWPLAGSAEAQHEIHRGVAKEVTCGQTSLDRFIAERGISRLSLIKIDTDGAEFDVLSSAETCLSSMKPLIIFEACSYLMQPPNPTFDDFEALLRKHSYSIFDSRTLERLDAKRFESECPTGGGLDLAAMPD